MTMTKNRLAAIAMAIALAFAPLVATPASAAAAAPTSPLSIPITGSGSGGTFAGTFNLNNFAVQNGQLMANGTLLGTLTNTVTGVVTSVVQTVSMPVSDVSGTCQILHLELGPLDLNLLGLLVHLNQVVLDITAQSGPGNLLGNLLCAVAGLLDSPGGLSQVLNQILGVLRAA
jgi:hypothetical protein